MANVKTSGAYALIIVLEGNCGKTRSRTMGSGLDSAVPTPLDADLDVVDLDRSVDGRAGDCPACPACRGLIGDSQPAAAALARLHCMSPFSFQITGSANN